VEAELNTLAPVFTIVGITAVKTSLHQSTIACCVFAGIFFVSSLSFGTSSKAWSLNRDCQSVSAHSLLSLVPSKLLRIVSYCLLHCFITSLYLIVRLFSSACNS